MLIYEVNIQVSNVIFEEYKIWLQDHIKDMLNFEGFLTAKIFLDITDIYTDSCNTTGNNKKLSHSYLLVQYEISSQEYLDDYFVNHAQKMRQLTLDRYGDYLTITRRVYKI